MTIETPKNSFPKAEKLTHQRIIGRLFEEGRFVKAYPFKILYLPNEQQIHQVAIGVPKRKIKLAVDRNKAKRRMREVYRLHKQQLFAAKLPPMAMMLLYHGNCIPSYALVEKKLVLLLQELINKESKNSIHEKDTYKS
jgi:ribonuclease P protein component